MAKKTEVQNKVITNSLDLAHAWGITDRRVRQLVNEGVIETVGRGKYDKDECTLRYCTYLRALANASEGKKKIQLSYDEEHAIYEKVKRETAELQLKVMRGELHRSQDVEAVMTDMNTRVKTKMRGISSTVAPLIIGYKDISKVTDIINKHVNEALIELSDYNPNLFFNDKVVKDDNKDD